MNLEQVSEILKRYLRQGRCIEIDGLGVFEQKESGRYVFRPTGQRRVFIAYAQEDWKCAEKIAEQLRGWNCDPWLDKQQLMPGQDWHKAIADAISVSDHFVALFSRKSVVKRGQFQREVRMGLAASCTSPLGLNFFLPVRLDDCRVPHQIQDQIQYVDLFPDWDAGLRRLGQALRSHL